jgi:uncharacterized protein YjbI with pentapeptide repeats
MSYQICVYVDAEGKIYGASETDQAYTRAEERTVHGRPVAYAGHWYSVQFPFRPFRRSVEAARQKAAMMEGKRTIRTTNGHGTVILQYEGITAEAVAKAVADGVSFNDAIIGEVNLSETNLSGGSFRGADMAGANLGSARLDHCDFSGSHMARVCLSRSSLDSARCIRANLTYANMEEASLYGATFERACLRRANFRGADVRNAIFCGADLRRAFFRHAKLRGADFRGALLDGADFEGAEIEGAIFEGKQQ